MGLSQSIEECVAEGLNQHQMTPETTSLQHLGWESEAFWSKIDHLLYLPIMGLVRPRDLYYFQGDGLRSVYGFTYKYLTLEHFLGQLTRLQVGYPLADKLAASYARAWYPGRTPVYVFTDWHIKPHWTKQYSHTGHVTMWGRSMPGTKQLIINGPKGYLLGGWNYPIDAHLTHVLVDLEEELEATLRRLILFNIFDAEGGGRPLSERYAEAERCYISVLPRQHAYSLADFALVGDWQPVVTDPEREVVLAHWAQSDKAETDPRCFALLRPVGQTQPSRIYTVRIPKGLAPAFIPWFHRRRWANNELRIRELINGANLNANYGYTAEQVPNRTRQRQWDKLQTKIESTQTKLSQHQEAIRTLRHKMAHLQQSFAQQRSDLLSAIARQRLGLERRQSLSQPTKLCARRLQRLRQQLSKSLPRFLKRERRLWQHLCQRQTKTKNLHQQLLQRQTEQDAIDTPTLCWERHLEKDQIMLDLQILLANLHDWAKRHYFASDWQNLTLNKAIQLIYRKSGRVTWLPDRIQIVLNSYRYRQHQRAMEITCRRFNRADLRWRDGRLLRFSVQPNPNF
jgi:hypothetical protein